MELSLPRSFQKDGRGASRSNEGHRRLTILFRLLNRIFTAATLPLPEPCISISPRSTAPYQRINLMGSSSSWPLPAHGRETPASSKSWNSMRLGNGASDDPFTSNYD